MKPAASTNAGRHESCLAMGRGLEFRLIDITARVVTRRTERLLAVARLTVRRLALSCQAVRELEVQVVDLRQP